MRELGNKSQRGVSEGGAQPRPETHHAAAPGPPRRPYHPARQHTPPVSPARRPPTEWTELIQVHDDRDVVQDSPDELLVIDIQSLQNRGKMGVGTADCADRENRRLGRDFAGIRARAAHQKTASHTNRCAQKKSVAGPTGAKVALTVLSFNTLTFIPWPYFNGIQTPRPSS